MHEDHEETENSSCPSCLPSGLRGGRARSAHTGIIPRMTKMRHTIAAAVVAVASTAALALAQAPTMYGPSINADTAKKVAAPAVAEAKKNNWMMAVAVVDTAGELVYFERMDDTQVGSIDVAIDKAKSAARFKRPTKAFQDALAAGGEGLRILAL